MSTPITYIQQLITEGGDQNFLIIHLKGDAYIQFAGERNSSKIYAEVSGSNPKINFYLTAKQIEQLVQLNWTLSTSPHHNNYSQNLEILDDVNLKSIAELIQKTALIFDTSISEYTYQLNLQ